MARTNLATAKAAVNVANKTTSYVIIYKRKAGFTPAVQVVSPVTDANNGTDISFTATPTQIDGEHVRVKLVAISGFVAVQTPAPPAPAPAAAAAAATAPVDGILSITLTDGNSTILVAETPVDYINDPSAP